MKLIVRPATPGPSPCGTCKILYGSTCCESKEGDGPRFPVTHGEARRIASWNGRPGDILSGVVLGTEDPRELYAAAGPEHTKLLVDRIGLFLPTNADGSCVYLGPEGCTIPNAKPFVCATFPFRYDEELGWTLGQYVNHAGFCYGQDAATDLAAAMELFGETPATLEGKRARWLKDVRLHHAKMRKLIEDARSEK